MQFDLNGDAGGQQFGVSPEQWRKNRPALSPENEQVLEVWDFCEGWNPALIPVAAVYHGITDLDFLVRQLLVLRNTINNWQRAQRQAQEQTRR